MELAIADVLRSFKDKTITIYTEGPYPITGVLIDFNINLVHLRHSTLNVDYYVPRDKIVAVSSD